MTTTSSLPDQRVLADSKWQFFPGYVMGLVTPCIRGQIRALRIDEFLPELFVDELIRATDIDELEDLKDWVNQRPIPMQEVAVVELLLKISGVILAAHKIPSLGDSKVVPTNEPGAFEVFMPCFHPAAALGILNWVISSVNQGTFNDVLIPPDESQRYKLAYQKMVARHGHASLQGINNMHFLRAAHGLGIQIQMLDLNGTFIYGTGIHRRILKSGFTDVSPYLGVIFAQSKQMTSGLLRAAGIPTPEQCLVKNEADALKAATRLGFPVVIKPNSCDGGRGVFAGLNTREAVSCAFHESVKHCPDILVERFVAGEDYRLTVHNGRVIKIIHRRAGGVIGDGISTISALVKDIQSSEEMRRNFRHYKRHILDLDEEALGLLTERGLNANAIPKAGELIPLRRKSNISSGGVQTVIEVGQAHPDNLLLAERATRCLALDLAGVDMLIPDISISWLESGAHIIEVNSSPQISIVNTPDIYKQIMQQLVSEGGYIPVHYRILRNDDDYPSEEILEALRSQLQCHSCVSKYGVSIEGRRCSQPLGEVFQAMRGVTLDPSIESILVALQFNDLQRYGLPTSRYESLVLWSSHDSVENAGFVKKIKDLLRLDGDTDIKIVRWTREDTK